MMKLKRRDLFAASVLLATPAIGHAQAAYPNRPVRFIVPFPPGNMADLISRLMMDEMTNRGGVQIWWITAPAPLVPSAFRPSRAVRLMAIRC